MGKLDHRGVAIPANYSKGQHSGPTSYLGLKDIFNAPFLWKHIFGQIVSEVGGYDEDEPPHYSIYRKNLKVNSNAMLRRVVPHPGDGIWLHILYLNSENGFKQSPRNQFANSIEALCSRCFYGPLVVVYGEQEKPYRLYSFKSNNLFDRINKINELE